MTGNKEREFIAARQLALQCFMNFVINHSYLKHSITIHCFLNPVAYSSNIIGNYIFGFHYKPIYIGHVISLGPQRICRSIETLHFFIIGKKVG